MNLAITLSKRQPLHEMDSNWLKLCLKSRQRVDVCQLCCNTSGMNCFDFCFCSRTNNFSENFKSNVISGQECCLFPPKFSFLWTPRCTFSSAQSVILNVTFYMSSFLFSVHLQFSNSLGYSQAVCYLMSSCQLAAHWLYF